jgi:DNA-binding IclR family transcriptional regulator
MRNTSGLESVDNALRLLLLLAEQDRIRVSDAAAQLGIALSTAHRLLSTLRQRGFVEQEPNRTYVKGPAFDRLQGRSAPGLSLEDLVRPHLERLRDQVDETAHLAVPDGAAHLRFVLSVESSQSLRVGSRVGARLPVHRTSGGKALLAALPPQELARRLEDDGPDSLHLSVAEAARLRRELGGVRRQGYGLNKAESERGIAAVGIAMLGSDRTPVGALSISVPTVRLNPARLREMATRLLETKAALERDLAA